MIDRRPDRFGRGGDHEPFLKLGYPAVRFSVAAENWDRQHQDLRTEKGVVYGDTIEGMDFPYLAKVTAINIATLARIAGAPAAPEDVTIAGALSRDTTVKWSAVPGAAGYRVRWRRNDTQVWTDTRDVTGTENTARAGAGGRHVHRRFGIVDQRCRKLGQFRGTGTAAVGTGFR